MFNCSLKLANVVLAEKGAVDNEASLVVAELISSLAEWGSSGRADDENLDWC